MIADIDIIGTVLNVERVRVDTLTTVNGRALHRALQDALSTMHNVSCNSMISYYDQFGIMYAVPQQPQKPMGIIVTVTRA